MELIAVKLLVMTLSGVLRVFFGMFPLLVVKTVMKTWSKATDERIKKIISILMFFGGGVLLATCFLHMMPEVRDSFAKADPDLPLSEVVFLAGFFLVYLIEDVVHSIIHTKKRHQQEDKGETLTQRQPRITRLRNSFNKLMRKGDLSCGTLTNGDKELHNHDEVDEGRSCEVVSTTESSISTNAPDPTEARHGNNHNTLMVVNTNGICATSITASSFPARLSLSTVLANSPVTSPVEKTDEEHCSNPNPSHSRLRETREIFRKNSNADEVPGLNKIVMSGGGVTNLGFVSNEKFQYCDPDWWKDIVNTNSRSNSPHCLTCSMPSCVSTSCQCKAQDHCSTTSHSAVGDKCNNNSHAAKKTRDELQIPGSNSVDLRRNNNNSHSHMHLPMDNNDNLDESIGGEIRNLLIVIAISFHGIFEGMAIGLQSTEMDVWYLFLAVSLHECTILFCIGVELISSKTKVFRMVLYILVVSLVSPVGIIIGIIVSEKSFGDLIHRALIVGCFQVSLPWSYKI
jgi:zinc transporter ZupT